MQTQVLSSRTKRTKTKLTQIPRCFSLLLSLSHFRHFFSLSASYYTLSLHCFPFLPRFLSLSFSLSLLLSISYSFSLFLFLIISLTLFLAVSPPPSTISHPICLSPSSSRLLTTLPPLLSLTLSVCPIRPPDSSPLSPLYYLSPYLSVPFVLPTPHHSPPSTISHPICLSPSSSRLLTTLPPLLSLTLSVCPIRPPDSSPLSPLYYLSPYLSVPFVLPTPHHSPPSTISHPICLSHSSSRLLTTLPPLLSLTLSVCPIRPSDSSPLSPLYYLSPYLSVPFVLPTPHHSPPSIISHPICLSHSSSRLLTTLPPLLSLTLSVCPIRPPDSSPLFPLYYLSPYLSVPFVLPTPHHSPPSTISHPICLSHSSSRLLTTLPPLLSLTLCLSHSSSRLLTTLPSLFLSHSLALLLLPMMSPLQPDLFFQSLVDGKNKLDKCPDLRFTGIRPVDIISHLQLSLWQKLDTEYTREIL